jgi:hypothetical protein
MTRRVGLAGCGFVDEELELEEEDGMFGDAADASRVILFVLGGDIDDGDCSDGGCDMVESSANRTTEETNDRDCWVLRAVVTDIRPNSHCQRRGDNQWSEIIQDWISLLVA